MKTALSALIVALLGMPAAASASSLPDGPGPRPGPDLLYAKRAGSPQLENRGPWRAKPILISGASAYRKGEFLYQDFLYDDTGARMTSDPGEMRFPSNLFSKQNGTYLYPDSAEYANNAADLVELRVKPLRRSTAFRVSLNTLLDRSVPAFTIAIGGREGRPREFPFDANVRAPARMFLTVHPEEHGTVGVLTDAADGRRVGASLPTRVSMRRRQIEVRVPHRRWDPKRRKVRLAAGIGLWDTDAGRYLQPGTARSASRPGGAGGAAAPSAFFNVAFREDEPFPKPTDNLRAVTDGAWWRDRAQGTALAEGDISRFFARVSFRKLERGVPDNRRVPRTGPMDRIYASSFELAQGIDYTHTCLFEPATCPGQYQGRLQPYAIYVPKKEPPRRGYGLTLLLHSLSANYNQYLGTRNQTQYGERGRGWIVITPEARGPDEFYENYGAADVFDVWADVARRFDLDPDRVVTTGYSMGGIGSFKLAAQFPDLFSRIHSTVGFEGETAVLASLRNVPVLMWNNRGDELVNDLEFTQTANALDELGYRYEFDAFQPCLSAKCSALFPNHLQLAVNDWYLPGARFLGDERVDRSPAHVTYVLYPPRNHPELGVEGNGAYWVDDLEMRPGAENGRIDARSHGFGAGDPPPRPTERGSGRLEGGNLGPLVYSSQARRWGEAPAVPRRDRIDLTASGISSASIHPRRAGVGCGARVEIVSDGPVSITLLGCGRTVKGGR